MDSNHVTNVIPLRAEEDRDLESPTHTPPTAYNIKVVYDLPITYCDL